MGDFRMPSLGADMTEGKVVEWRVKPGDHVDRGDIIAEVDTAKTVMEVETFEAGTVTELLVDLGETVPVGTPIARLDGATAPPAPAAPAAAPEIVLPVEPAPGPAPADAEATEHEPAPHATPPVRHLAHELGVDLEHLHGSGRGGSITRADVEAAAAPAPSPHEAAETTPHARAGHVRSAPARDLEAATAATGRVRSSPAARRLAQERGLDLAAIRGTGPGGAVTLEDVRGTAATGARATEPASGASATEPASSAPAVAPASVIPASAVTAEPAPATAEPAPTTTSEPEAETRADKLHAAVGSLMSRSKREIPHYYLSTTIDLGAALDWMRKENSGRRITQRLVPSALLLAAAAKAAKQAPRVNGFFTDGRFRPSESVHLGVAMALRGGGLVAPAIHDADALTLDELMGALRDLASRAQAGRLHRAEMADPTITITNLGDLGVESIFGVIYPPQVALVGFGRVVERPVARAGLLGVRPTVTATLSADHRASDGMDGGRFLALIDELLQKPEEL